MEFDRSRVIVPDREWEAKKVREFEMAVQGTMMRQSPEEYSSIQIWLHWIIAGLVTFQLFSGDLMFAAWNAVEHGTQPTATALSNADFHIFAGITVLVLALWRFAIRLRRGVPPLAPDESAVVRWIARITHFILYLVIFGMPISGIVAWYGGVIPVGELHRSAKLLIIVFVVLHVAGALYEHFVARNQVLMRMLGAGPDDV